MPLSIKNRFIFLLLFVGFSHDTFAFSATQTSLSSELNSQNNKTISENNPLKLENALLMLDYEIIPLPNAGAIDLFGIHYLHQMNNWLYLGLGVHAPLVYGNYGGFMAVDATVHAQHNFLDNTFINAGASFGGGGGGSSIQQSKELSGTGGFTKRYIGLGYDFHSFSAGANYTHFQFKNAQINHSQLNFFIQKPLSYSLGSYADSGKTIEIDSPSFEAKDMILAFELNNIFQIKPKGTIKENINSVSLQLSSFLTDNHYLFLGGDIGYYGRPLYNQIIGGAGYKFTISSHMNLYSQIGVGSGGYSPVEVDTGPGLLIYPKFSFEYSVNNNIGLTLSSGYLFAPKGSSKNYTLGASMNYHLSPKLKVSQPASHLTFQGFRFSAFKQTEFNVQIGKKKHDNINLVSFQLDSLLNDHWFIPVQLSVASNEYTGFPGYGEILTGLGIQSEFSSTRGFQGFFQALIGANVHGLVLKPTIGFNYSHNDSLAVYGQLGKTASINKGGLYNETFQLSASHIGLGLTFRFSTSQMYSE